MEESGSGRECRTREEDAASAGREASAAWASARAPWSTPLQRGGTEVEDRAQTKLSATSAGRRSSSGSAGTGTEGRERVSATTFEAPEMC